MRVSEIMQSLLLNLFLVAGLQGLILTVVLLTKTTRNQKANQYLAACVALFSIRLLDLYAQEHWQYFYDLPFLYPLQFTIDFLYIPLFFAYVRKLTNPEWFWRPIDHCHWLPALMSLALFIPYYMLPIEQQIAHFKPWFEGIQPDQSLPELYYLFSLRRILVTTQWAVYLGCILVILKRHQVNIRQLFSSVEHINLNWIRLLTLGFLFVLSVYIISSLIPDWLGVYYQVKTLLFSTSASLAILIYALGYVGLFQRDIFTESMPTPNPTAKKPTSSVMVRLTPEAATALRDELQQLMIEQQPHLEGDLTLNELASMIGISQYQLSELLNKELHQSFFDFINSYRIEAAKQRLIERSEAIVDVAMNVGFNSKSSFNNAFKKLTGQTPSQYRKENR